jgi:Ca2+-binding EF-hand superfamily protein
MAQIEVPLGEIFQSKSLTSSGNDRSTRWDQDAVDDELRHLAFQHKAANRQLGKSQRALSNSIFHEHRCQDRAEQHQSQLEFHRQKAAIVNKQIAKLSVTLKTRERAVWDARQGQRERRLMNSQVRGTSQAWELDRDIASSSTALSPPATASMGQLAMAAPRSAPGDHTPASRARLSNDTSCLERKLPPMPANSLEGSRPSTAVVEVTDDGGMSRMGSLQVTDHRGMSKSSSMPITGSPFDSVPVARPGNAASCERREDKALELRRPAELQRPSSGESDLDMMNRGLFPPEATLLDYFADKEKSWQGKKPQLSPESFKMIPLGPDGSALDESAKRPKSRVNKQREKSRPLEMSANEQQWLAEEEFDRNHAATEREAKIQDRANMVSAIEEQQEQRRLRAEIRWALSEKAGSGRKAFNALDANRSGRVSMNEFAGGINSLGVDWTQITGYGKICEKTDTGSKVKKEKITELFKLFDVDKKGFITMHDLYPVEVQSSEDVTRMSTPEFWRHWCRHTKDISPTASKNARWESNGAEEALEIVRQARQYQASVDEKKRWMKNMFYRLKGHGKSDARCREVIATHLPRGSGAPDIQEVRTFSRSDLEVCKKHYNDDVQEVVRSIEKSVGAMHDQRKTLHQTKQKLWLTTEEPRKRAETAESIAAGFGGLFKKHHEESD